VQLVVALRRRVQLGNQWPLLLANGVSVIGGVAFLIAAAAVGHPKLSMLAIYAATGGIEFVWQAWLLTRRRRRLTNADPLLSAS
jgi:Flp pilus assembly protein TadB